MNLTYLSRYVRHDLFRLSLLWHRDAEGYFATGQQSGTHWISNLMAAAICLQYGVPKPAHIRDRSLICHPRLASRDAHLPRLVRTHQTRVYSVALRLTGSREDAEELAQDAFVQLHAALPQVESMSHVLHWLLRAITHRSIDRLRARERAPRLVQIDTANEPAGSEVASDPLWEKRLQGLLLELPADAF